MGIGTVYELQHKQEYLNEPMQNTYHFEGLTGDADAEKLCELFIVDYLPKVSAIQVNNVIELALVAYALFDFADFFEDTAYAAGTKPAGTPLVAHTAVNFSLKTVRRDVGPGSKRYSGLSETWITGNFFDDTGFITAANALRAQMSLPLTDGATDTFRPVIVKRVEYAATESAKAGYYMPRVIGDLDFAAVRTAVWNTRASKQGSRNNGK